jgi:predicted dehydrogenase/threonine dehydrogenase-like Zn-dependent dehydrogenase
MRQVFLSKSGSIFVGDAPVPALGTGEVLIEVAFSVISTGTEASRVAETDLKSRLITGWQTARLGAERLRSAGIEETLRKARARDAVKGPIGYSVAGIIRAVGEGISDLASGMLVAAAGSGYANHAEMVVVPRNLVVRVPGKVTLRAASFATVGAIALQGVRRASPQVGETVLVIGLGLVGQLSVQILGAAGCRVIGVDPRADRMELASSGMHGLVGSAGAEGADIEREVMARTAGVGADAVLLCAGTHSSDASNTALRAVRQRGRVVVVGTVGMELERNPFYQKEVEFTISCSYGPGRYDPSYEEGGIDYPIGFVRWTENRNLAAFLDLVARKRVDPESLIAGEYDLEDASQAFSAAKSGESRRSDVLRYPEGEKPPRRIVEVNVSHRTKPKGAIGVAVIGAGGFAARTLLPAIVAEKDFVLRTVVTKSGASATRVAQEFRAQRASTDWEEVLSDGEVDAVVIATRHDTHAELALSALRAGKHVLLEKPMGISRDEIDSLRDVASESDHVFTVGYNRRYAPLSIEVRDALIAGGASCIVQYRVNAGQVPRGHWTIDPDVGGGRIVGEACHMLDLLAFWLGPDVVDWNATALASSDPEAPSPQDFSVSLKFRAPDGRDHVASLVYTSLGAKSLPKERIECHTGGGSLVLTDFVALEVQGLPARSSRLRNFDKGHRAEIRSFLDAIRGRESALLGVHEAYRAADLALRIDAALRS